MAADKLLHVSCIVRASPAVYDLLIALEAHKVGNVEVRPVKPMLMLPPPAGQEQTTRKRGKVSKHGAVLGKVRKAMKIREPIKPTPLSKELGVKAQSVHSAITNLVRHGL